MSEGERVHGLPHRFDFFACSRHYACSLYELAHWRRAQALKFEAVETTPYGGDVGPTFSCLRSERGSSVRYHRCVAFEHVAGVPNERGGLLGVPDLFSSPSRFVLRSSLAKGYSGLPNGGDDSSRGRDGLHEPSDNRCRSVVVGIEPAKRLAAA